jgi:endonuclease-3
MATTINKQRVLSTLLGQIRKTSDADHPGRPVLEQLIYGLCREGATADQADRAYDYLCETFFDWNEIRVSSQRELEEAFEGMSDAETRAQRLVAFLQEVFENTYSFDLEFMQKKGVKQAAKELGRYQAANEYLVAWVIQRTLGGHAIPLDPPTLRSTRRLGLLESHQEDTEAARSSLEHLVPKAKGPQFTDTISTIADQFCFEIDPNCHGCPLSSECVFAHEAGVEPLASTRSRPKPR